MSEKALFEQLQRWIETGEPPSRALRILHSALDPDDEFADRTTYDGFGNARGGIRHPMVAAPVASFGAGQIVLTDGCPEIVPFDDATLDALYPTRQNYLDQYDAATARLLRRGFILTEDVAKLRSIARNVTSVGWPLTGQALSAMSTPGHVPHGARTCIARERVGMADDSLADLCGQLF